MEDGPVQPASLFAASKLAGEMYCRVFHTKHGLETVALRYFTVYGPRQTRVDDSLTVAAFLDALLRRRPVVDADPATALDFTYVTRVMPRWLPRRSSGRPDDQRGLARRRRS
jgi:UDP-glucose 4-epimerase